MNKSILIVCTFLMFCSNSFAAKWLPLPATDIKSKCPPNNFKGSTYSYTSKCGNVVRAWSGGVWDDANRTMYLWGGGHGDYIGNEVYKLDISLTTGVTMNRITDPDIWPAGTFGPCVDEVPGTNNPVARHTYGNMAFLPAASSGLGSDKIWIHGGARACGSGGFGSDDWMFDLSTKTWTKLSPTGRKPGAIILFAAYHPGNNKIYMTGAEISAANNYFYCYDVATNNWTRQTFSPWLITGRVGHRNATLVGDDYYFMGGGGLWKVNVNGAPDYQWHVVSTTGATEIQDANSPGIAYDSKRKVLVGWNGSSTNVASQSIYTLNLSTLVWTKTTVVENAPTHSEGQMNGTFGRFAYSSKMDCYVAVSDYNQNATLFCPDDYPTDLWFSRSLVGATWSNGCVNGICKHIRMGQIPGSDSIYFFGGDQYVGSATSAVHSYNVNTNSWTLRIPQCATDGTPQLDGMDEGALFYNTVDGKFYYFFAGNYCSQKRDNLACAYPNIYNPKGAYGSCANSAMVTRVNIKYNPTGDTWDTSSLLANSPIGGSTHWIIHDPSLNKAFIFGPGNRNGVMVYTYNVATDSWSSSTKLRPADFPFVNKGHWSHDISGRVVYLWDAYYGKIYKYDIPTDTMSLINSSAPKGRYDQYQSVWDSANNIMLMNECWEPQTFPMRFHTYEPSTDTWTKNIVYNSWNGKQPWGRESFYDAAHNLLILLGYVESPYGTNQMWFYRYGGAGTKPSTDATPHSTPQKTRKTP